MERSMHVLRASVVLVCSSILVVQITCILNRNLISRLGMVLVVAFLEDLLRDTHSAKATGVTAKSGS